MSINDDIAYWNKLADALGWKIHGFWNKQHACFSDSSGYHVEITSTQRDDILRAIEKAKTHGKHLS